MKIRSYHRFLMIPKHSYTSNEIKKKQPATQRNDICFARLLKIFLLIIRFNIVYFFGYFLFKFLLKMIVSITVGFYPTYFVHDRSLPNIL